MAAPVIIVMGPQGSGKGTQCRLLSQKLNYVTFSSGALLRETKDPDIHSRMTKGLLVRSKDVERVMSDAIEGVEPAQGIVIDGFPRMVNEAEWLIQTLSAFGREVRSVIFLVIPRDESVKRLTLRAGLEARDDDSLAGINRRLELFESETRAVLDLWRSKGLLKEVDGVGTVEDVAERIDVALV